MQVGRTPRTPATLQLIDADALAVMKPGDT